MSVPQTDQEKRFPSRAELLRVFSNLSEGIDHLCTNLQIEIVRYEQDKEFINSRLTDNKLNSCKRSGN